jgi:hypothetical protein
MELNYLYIYKSGLAIMFYLSVSFNLRYLDFLIFYFIVPTYNLFVILAKLEKLCC